VGVLRALVVAVALVALALLPCAVALLITHVDEIAERMWRAVRRGARRTRACIVDYRVLRGRADAPSPVAAPGPPIEQLAADLRRLGLQRVGIAMRSTLWFAAVQRAYDDRLQQACRALGVDEHLADLEGLDRDIERVRIEGELQAAGLVLGSIGANRRQDHR
jgi:hypothetical protein